jgi:hypothetical protein
MRPLRPSSEAEMVALFLRIELGSARFGPRIRAVLARDGLAERMITGPDLGDEEENAARARVLYGPGGYRDDHFEGFPEDVRWQWMAITSTELAQVRYMDYPYWNELTRGSRLPADAVPAIRAGVSPPGTPTSRLLELAGKLAAGARFAPLILVTTGPAADLVVLEGHSRLSAYLLAWECVPAEVEVLVGTSESMTRWGSW